MYVPSLELGLPHPFSRKRVCPPPGPKGGGAHLPVAKGVGESQFQRLEKRLALCLLCALILYIQPISLHINVSVDWKSAPNSVLLLSEFWKLILRHVMAFLKTLNTNTQRTGQKSKIVYCFFFIPWRSMFCFLIFAVVFNSQYFRFRQIKQN